ncbi:hypothetical protein ACROYT_G002193 [Oculina patagonica]
MARCISACLLSLLTLLQWLLLVKASHFRYGDISWTPAGSSGNTIRFTFRLAFRKSYSNRYYCDENTVRQGSLIGYGDSWSASCSNPSNPQCSSSTHLADTGFRCTDFSNNEDWSMGENNFTYTFPSSNQPWTVSYSSCCWISSLYKYADGSWLVSTKIDLTRRSDIGRINSSPKSRSPAIVRFQEGCPKSLRIPVEDPDEDVVKCRWASQSESNMNSDSFPYGVLDEQNCVLKYLGRSGTAGTYAVTLTLEDFPAGTTNFNSVRPFSAVGLQFLVIITSQSGSCDDIPVFTESTPQDGECSEVQIGSPYTTVIEVQLADFAKHVVEITTSSPSGMQVSSLRFHGGIYYRNVTWYPSQYQVGQQLFCFQALDSSGLQSEWRCVTILVGLSNTPNVILGTQWPIHPISETGPGLIWWRIHFDRVIKKPRTSGFIRLVLLPNSHTVYKVDTLSQYVIIDSNRTVLHFATPKAALSMNGSYAILIDHGAVVGQGCSYDGPPTPGIPSPGDWGFPVDGICPVGYALAAPGFTNCVDVNECDAHSRKKRELWWWQHLAPSSTALHGGATASVSFPSAGNPITCHACISDAGPGDDIALCNSEQIRLPCTSPVFPALGQTHCFTAAGRYRYLDGSQEIHTGVARGCIDCSNKTAACEVLAAAFNSYQNWTLLDCNIECCTGDDCNNQDVAVTSEAQECVHHSYLEDSVRRMSYYNGYYGYYQCDSNLPFGWYRFRGAAGTEMPTTCVKQNHCSSHAPGWLNNTHPTVADGIVNATVCFHWTSGCCHWWRDIRVRNCSGFYVYELGPTPSCWLRYCGNGGGDGNSSGSATSSVVLPTPASISPTASASSSAGFPSVPTSCDFDSGLCYGWRQSYSDDFDWIRHRGSTGSSYTGPDYDHTTGSGYYMYIETSSPRAPGDSAKLELSVPANGELACLVFYYHMYGDTMGNFTVFSGNAVVFNKSGNHGNYWMKEEITIYLDKTVTFEGIRGSSYRGDIAIDDVSITNGICQRHVSVPTSSPTASASAGPSYPTECVHHSYLEDSERAMGFYNGYHGYYQCDSHLSGWYRFRGAAGDQMPTSCVGKNRCSSHAPGWLNGAHPSVADGAVYATVCFHWSSGCCTWSTSIRVRNCSGFYVYELGPTPACWLRYCGNGGGGNFSMTTMTSTTSITRTTNISPTPASISPTASASSSPGSPSGSCSYSLTGLRGNFTSPNYPYDYPTSVTCDWTITVIPGYFIYLHFEHFHLEHAYGAAECPYDYVEIFDGTSSSSTLIAKRCDYQDSWCIYSTGYVLHVKFVSDVIIARSGFTAYYEQVHRRYPMCLHLNSTLHSRNAASTPSSQVTPTPSQSHVATPIPGSCYHHLNQPSGYFASPHHPGCYPNDKYCTWLIEAPFGQYIYLYFFSFHLEYGTASCPWDFVEIFDGNSIYSHKIIRACGQLAPWEVYSSGRFLLVQFFSDDIIMMPGFSATYQATPYHHSVSLPSQQVSSSSAVQCVATHAATATTTATATVSNSNGIHPTPASAMPSSFYPASSINVQPNPSDFELHLPADCDQVCSNTLGSYTCSCVQGYRLAPDEKSCLDIDECSTNNGGCSHHCFNIPGSFYCGCPEGRSMGANNFTCVEPGVSVNCGDSNMTVALEIKSFPFFEVDQLHLRYSSCRATKNDTHLLISTPLNNCGTLVNETQDALIFWNEIRADAVVIDFVITRTHDIKIPFYCSYSRKKLLSLSFTPQPLYFDALPGYGNFTFRIDFCKSPSCDTFYTQQDYPLDVELNDYMYVRYSVESSADLVIMAENCKATKDGSFYSWPQYTIIQNGCPRDTTMEYSYNPMRNFQQFKFKTFRFFDDYATVYLHCEVLACHKYSPNSRCSQGCSNANKRKRRDVTRDEIEHEESTNKYILTQGPLVFKEPQEAGDTSQNKQTALIGGVAAAGGFGLIAVAALAVLFVKYRIARRFMNRNKVGDLYTTQDEQLSRRNAYIQEDDMIEKEDAL